MVDQDKAWAAQRALANATPIEAAPMSVPLSASDLRKLRNADVLAKGGKGDKAKAADIYAEVENDRRDQRDTREVQTGLAETVRLETLWRGMVEIGAKPNGGMGRVRCVSRDGLGALLTAKSITEAEFQAGMAYRYCYERAGAGLGSQLGAFGDSGSGGKKPAGLARDAAGVQAAYVMARLRAFEAAILGAEIVGGQLVGASATGVADLDAMRKVAGQGLAIRSLTPSTRRRVEYREQVKRGLAALIARIAARGVANRDR